MDIVFEVIFEVFLELFFLIVPEKNRSKGYMIAAKSAAILLPVLVAVLVLWGGVLLVDYHSSIGVIPITLAAIISLAVIVFGIVNYDKNH